MSYSINVGASSNVREMSPLQTRATKEVEGLVFQLASSLTQLKKLVDMLGGPKDTVEHRHKIGEVNQKIQNAAKQVKQQMTGLHAEKETLSEAEQLKAKKLLQDFTAILQEYKAVQKVAAEREGASLPKAPPAPQVLVSSADEGADEQLERQALLQQQQQRQAQVMGNVLEYNEALIEERDQGIAEIHRQIGEVNEMFQDLAVLVNDQGQQLLTIDDQITATAERTRDGGAQLIKAERSQRSARNKCLCIWLVAALVLAVVIIVLFT